MSNTVTKPGAVAPTEFEQEMVTLDEGVESQLPAGVSLTINGVAQKAGVIDSTLQNWIDIFKAVDSAKASYQTAVAARLAITAAAKAYVKALKAVIKAYFGPQSVQLAAFGIPMDKARTTTAQDNLVAAAKRKQTRTLHGTTLGKKQKAALTVVGNPPVNVPSTGELQIGPPPVNIGGINTPSSEPSGTVGSAAGSTPSSTAAPSATPAPAGSGSGGGTPSTGGSTPAGA